ncbi:type IV secretory system conjugative DNA transfer family protein [Caulobacter sp. 73W]|uniref:Type IV secretory system conjugative DNA transfer family protein n=1 Tax=Caulobacter sp. 73W TaxID=3161137 RepID=A0AB39KR89_9CAUL
MAMFTGLTLTVALAGLGRLDPRIEVVRVIPWFWFHRDDEQVRRWLLIGAGTSGSILALLAAGTTRRRGAGLHGAARWATAGEIAQAGLRGSDGVILGSHGGRLLRSGGDEHVLVCAPTRSGKSAGIVIPTLLSWAGPVVVLDVKKEVFEATAGWRASIGQVVFLFDPLQAEGRTARFNPLGVVDREDMAAAYDAIHRVAGLLFPDQAKGDPFWTEAARSAFIAVTLYVAQSPSLPLTLGEIARQFTAGDLADRLTRSAESRRGGPSALNPVTERLIADFCRTSENTFAAIRQSVSTRLALWLNPRVDAATSKSDFTLSALRSRPMALYLAAAPSDLERVAPLYALLVQQLLESAGRSLPSSGDDKRLLVVLDEFASLGRAPMLARSFSWVAGYGVRLVCVVQTLSQLRARYGEDAAEITANCAVQAYFAPATIQDARELSETLGTYGHGSISRSKPSGLSSGRRSETHAEQRRPLLLPHELLTLDRETIIVAPRGRAPVRGKRLLWAKARAFSSRWRPPPPVPPRKLVEDGPVEAAALHRPSPGNVDLAMERMSAGRDLFGEARR